MSGIQDASARSALPPGTAPIKPQYVVQLIPTQSTAITELYFCPGILYPAPYNPRLVPTTTQPKDLHPTALEGTSEILEEGGGMEAIEAPGKAKARRRRRLREG
jgi:hypothetical protein